MNDFWLRVQRLAYQEGEDLEGFAIRIGKELFPEKDDDWFRHNAFIIHSYGMANKVCQLCRGQCPHQGFRYELRLDKQGDRLKLVALKERCPNYKKGGGRKNDKAATT